MENQGTRESIQVEGWSVDDRCFIAAAIAIKRYQARAKNIRATIEEDTRCDHMTVEEKQEMASRLMRRLVELS